MTVATKSPEFVEVRGRFHRSVQLVRDWQEHDLSGYLITPTVRDLIVRVVGELERPGGTRAWSITGPYGTGKSAFALFLTKLLADQLSNRSEVARLREDFRIEAPPFLPVLLVGQRSSLKPALLAALAGALTPIDELLAAEVAELTRAKPLADACVVSCFERAAAAAVQRGHGGLIVILDEFGKFLEHAAFNRDNEDLLVMQGLAEAASRSKVPVSLITILHTGFADYLDAVDEVQRAEWQKVQGRFTDVAFQEPPE
ncbi:MAG: hypothetical protein M3511_16660, partial [Deinococcota bacterium]|nr:hypothetical protein [Deinococcota bacterium]